MDSYDPPFQWLEFPEGRARFSGGVRGSDETGHETFAVDIDGIEYFGEIDRAFLPNDNDYNIEVISFGYGDRDVGWPMTSGCRRFTLAQVASIRARAVQLVQAGAHFPDPPHLLKQYPTARFMGEVGFRDGWVLVPADEVAA